MMRAAWPPLLASRPVQTSPLIVTVTVTVTVSADIQGAAWTGTVVLRRPLSTSHNRR